MKLKFYVCGIDYQHELGETMVKTYASPEDIKTEGAHKHCGIVEITIDKSNIKWVEEQKLEEMFKEARESKDE